MHSACRCSSCNSPDPQMKYPDILRRSNNQLSTTSWHISRTKVILVLTLVVCSARFTSTAGANTPHCEHPPPFDTPPCTCHKDSYGGNCTERCSLTCSGYGCNQTTGKCVSCKAGYYSFNCTLKCPPNCLNESGRPAKCDQDTGHCANCQPTWWGSNCTNKCEINCLNGVCDFENGHCHGCKDGKTGENCSEECPSECLRDQCDRDTKTCTSGCDPGYFGKTCYKVCGGNCKEVECATNGTTSASKTSSLCANCTGTCVCRQNTGHCHSCKSGYWGDMCEHLCPVHCPECSQTNGTCGSSSSSNASDRIKGLKEGEIAGSAIGGIVLVGGVIAMVLLFTRWRRGREAPKIEGEETEELHTHTGEVPDDNIPGGV